MQLIESKVITCILPRGKALPLIKKLKEEKNIITANVNIARGSSTEVARKFNQEARQTIEKDILTVVVDNSISEEIFEYLYFECELDKKQGGFMYQASLKGTVPFTLPEAPEEQ